LFGAIAGSGVLPFSRAAFEDTIRHSGRGVESSLRGFGRAFEMVAEALPEQVSTPGALPLPTLPDEISRAFPRQTHAMLAAGHARLVDYQDRKYAGLYVQRMARVLAAERAGDPAGTGNFATTSETARYLALWMAYDDIVRVADLKCRASRFERVRREVKASADDLVRIYDHFKPGVPEIVALLPRRWAHAITAWDRRRQQRGQPALAIALKLGVHGVSGFVALRLLSSLKWLRRRGSRFPQEQAMIERWLSVLEQGARDRWQLGHEIALCGRLIKGYGATNERGKDNLLHVLDQLASGTKASAPARADAIRAARVAALADEAGTELDKTLAAHGAVARPVKAQPIKWVRRRPGAAA
jgi:indolepyruvate ferredoxin oxidoreductase beta subunit